MAFMLQELLEPIYLRKSQGFRVAKTSSIFFESVLRWPAMDWVVQCSIDHSYDRIEHNLLRDYLLKWGEKTQPLFI